MKTSNLLTLTASTIALFLFSSCDLKSVSESIDQNQLRPDDSVSVSQGNTKELEQHINALIASFSSNDNKWIEQMPAYIQAVADIHSRMPSAKWADAENELRSNAIQNAKQSRGQIGSNASDLSDYLDEYAGQPQAKVLETRSDANGATAFIQIQYAQPKFAPLASREDLGCNDRVGEVLLRYSYRYQKQNKPAWVLAGAEEVERKYFLPVAIDNDTISKTILDVLDKHSPILRVPKTTKINFTGDGSITSAGENDKTLDRALKNVSSFGVHWQTVRKDPPTHIGEKFSPVLLGLSLGDAFSGSLLSSNSEFTNYKFTSALPTVHIKSVEQSTHRISIEFDYLWNFNPDLLRQYMRIANGDGKTYPSLMECIPRYAEQQIYSKEPIEVNAEMRWNPIAWKWELEGNWLRYLEP